MRQSLDLNQTITAWSALAKTVFVPHTAQDYERLVELLDSLIYQVGENETHPRWTLLVSQSKTTKLNMFLS